MIPHSIYHSFPFTSHFPSSHLSSASLLPLHHRKSGRKGDGGWGDDGQASAPPVAAARRAAPSPSLRSIGGIMKSKDSLAVTSCEEGAGHREQPMGRQRSGLPDPRHQADIINAIGCRLVKNGINKTLREQKRFLPFFHLGRVVPILTSTSNVPILIDLLAWRRQRRRQTNLGAATVLLR